MTVKMVSATKDVSKAFALNLFEVQKVIFIPAAMGLIVGNTNPSILNAFMYLSRIPPSRARGRYQLYNAHCSWQPELARCGFKPKHRTEPQFQDAAQLQPQAVSGLYWLTKGYRSHPAFPPSYSWGYPVWEGMEQKGSLVSATLFTEVVAKNEWQTQDR